MFDHPNTVGLAWEHEDALHLVAALRPNPEARLLSRDLLHMLAGLVASNEQLLDASCRAAFDENALFWERQGEILTQTLVPLEPVRELLPSTEPAPFCSRGLAPEELRLITENALALFAHLRPHPRAVPCSRASVGLRGKAVRNRRWVDRASNAHENTLFWEVDGKLVERIVIPLAA